MRTRGSQPIKLVSTMSTGFRKTGIYQRFDWPGVIERFVKVLQDQQLNAAQCGASIRSRRRTIATPYRLQIFQNREGRKPGVIRLTLHPHTR